MLYDTPCNLNFFDWLDALTDEEHHKVFEHLREVANDLGCRVDGHPLTAQHLLNFPPHRPSQPPLN